MTTLEWIVVSVISGILLVFMFWGFIVDIKNPNLEVGECGGGSIFGGVCFFMIMTIVATVLNHIY